MVNKTSEELYQLGLSHLSGSGVEINASKAFSYFEMAANKGHSEAHFELGYSYEYGRGVDKDREKALQWYQKAAIRGDTCGAKQDVRRLMIQKGEEGDANAQYWLAMHPNEKWQIGVDATREAMSWCRKSADRGNPDAQYKLGKAYIDGIGVDKDKVAAVYWFQKAAEQGKRDAQYELGKACLNGSGISKNYEMALHWYRKAAENGCIKSQYTMGCLYEEGRGVQKDIFVAASWWWKACEISESEDFEFLLEETLFAILKIKELYQSDYWKNSIDQRKQDMKKSLPNCSQKIKNIDINQEDIYLCGKMYELGAGISRNIIAAAYWWRYGPFVRDKTEDYSSSISALDDLYKSNDWKSIPISEKEILDERVVEIHEKGFFDIYRTPSQKYFQKTYLKKMAEDMLQFLNVEISAPKLNFRVPSHINQTNADEYKEILHTFLELPSHQDNEDEDKGYLYILINSAFPNLLKIGQTTRTPQERADELSSSTGVPYPFVVAHYEKVSNPVNIEKEVHIALEKYRSSKSREFFEIDIMEAKNIIADISDKYRD
jgi:uncharacterized protein